MQTQGAHLPDTILTLLLKDMHDERMFALSTGKKTC